MTRYLPTVLFLLLWGSSRFIVSTDPSLTGQRYFRNVNILMDNSTDLDTIANCTRLTVHRYVSIRNHVILACDYCGRMDARVLKYLVADRTVMTSSITSIGLLKQSPNYLPTYLIVKRNESFPSLRTMFLEENRKLSKKLQYLLVTTADTQRVEEFSRDAWSIGFKNMLFVVYDLVNHSATIGRFEARQQGGLGMENMFKVVGKCDALGSSWQVEQRPDFYHQICPTGNCSMRYSNIVDETVRYWKDEDRKMSNDSKALQTTVGGHLIGEFTREHNIEIVEHNFHHLNWTAGTAALLNDDVDVMLTLLPENASLEGLEIVAWYMYRTMVFTSKIKFRNLGNDIMKVIMPFSLTIWLCILFLSLIYILLIHILRRLYQTGLIREELAYLLIWQMTLAQGVILPKKIGLRMVLGIWIIFSLYFGVVYNSTFTGSLARMEEEDLLQSFEHVRDSGRPLGGPKIVLTYMENSGDPVIKDLYDRYQVLTVADVFWGVFNRDMVGVVQHTTVDRLNWQNRANKSNKVYTVPESMVDFPVIIIARKAHPFRDPLRRTVLRLRQIGLQAKWQMTNVTDEDKRITAEYDSGMLTMQHLHSVFYFFLLCYGVCIVAFIIELINFHWRRIKANLILV